MPPTVRHSCNSESVIFFRSLCSLTFAAFFTPINYRESNGSSMRHKCKHSCHGDTCSDWAWKVLSSLWLRPKRLERLLREQGLQGNPYKLVVGDVWEMVKMGNEAKSKPMNLLDDIAPRVSSFFYNTINKHGIQMLPTLIVCSFLLFSYLRMSHYGYVWNDLK